MKAIRSAKAPVMSAGVMMANISWKTKWAKAGMCGAQGPGFGAHAFQQDPGEVADDPAARVAGEGERVADEHPEHGHDAHRDEALQHDREEVLPSDQTAVEEGQARCHHHD